MEDVASVLNSLDALAAAEYERKSGQSKATVAGWMARNTWFTPTQALAAGLCSKVLTGRSPAAAKATAQTIKYYMRAGSLPDDVRAFMNPTAAALPQVRPVLPVPSTGAKKMKSTAITRGLFVALAGLSHYAALAAGSADPEEKALGEQLGALDVTAPTAQLTDVKAPELSSLLEVHDKVVAMVGSEDGLLGGLEAIEANAARKGAAAGADKMTQVNALLLAAVDPPKGQPRKLTPAMAASQRQAFTKNPDKPLADLKAFIRLAEPLTPLNTSEDEGAVASGETADAGKLDDDFEANMNAAGGAHKIGGAR